MISEIDVYYGDITDGSNRLGIIVAMNTALIEVASDGTEWRIEHDVSRNIRLGTVLTLEDTENQRLVHMIVCHHRNVYGGWHRADLYLRIGLDYLWYKYGEQIQFSTVPIGTGLAGAEYGADADALRAVLMASPLQLVEYYWMGKKPPQMLFMGIKCFRPICIRDPLTGELE